MPHIAVVPVAAILRTINRCGRKPCRIGQVTPSVVRIEGMAAMHAGLDLGVGLGGHAGLDYARWPDIGADFRSTANNRRLAKHGVHRLRQRINYFLKLTWQSSIR
jgi:hypothetical protein